MTRILSKAVAALLAVAMVGGLPIGAPAQPYFFWWQVVDERGEPYPSQTVVCSVYERTSHGAAVLHRDAGGVEPGVTNPLRSDAISKFHFYSNYDTDKNVNCFFDRGGQSTQVRLGRTTHKVMINRQGRKVVRFAANTSATVSRTGIWLPQGAVVHDILVHNVSFANVPHTVADEQEPHLNVGFAGPHAATYHSLVDRLHLGAQPEWIRPGTTSSLAGFRRVPVTGKTGAVFHATGFGVHRGYALATGARGAVSTIPGLSENAPFYVEHPFVVHVAGGMELVYQTSSTPGIVAHVYVIYEGYHVGVGSEPRY